jgi:hypothetical protein
MFASITEITPFDGRFDSLRKRERVKIQESKWDSAIIWQEKSPHKGSIWDKCEIDSPELRESAD